MQILIYFLANLLSNHPKSVSDLCKVLDIHALLSFSFSITSFSSYCWCTKLAAKNWLSNILYIHTPNVWPQGYAMIDRYINHVAHLPIGAIVAKQATKSKVLSDLLNYHELTMSVIKAHDFRCPWNTILWFIFAMISRVLIVLHNSLERSLTTQYCCWLPTEVVVEVLPLPFVFAAGGRLDCILMLLWYF